MTDYEITITEGNGYKPVIYIQTSDKRFVDEAGNYLLDENGEAICDS